MFISPNLKRTQNAIDIKLECDDKYDQYRNKAQT